MRRRKKHQEHKNMHYIKKQCIHPYYDGGSDALVSSPGRKSARSAASVGRPPCGASGLPKRRPKPACLCCRRHLSQRRSESHTARRQAGGWLHACNRNRWRQHGCGAVVPSLALCYHGPVVSRHGELVTTGRASRAGDRGRKARHAAGGGQGG